MAFSSLFPQARFSRPYFGPVLWGESGQPRTVSVLLSGGHRHLSHSCGHEGQFQSQAKVL